MRERRGDGSWALAAHRLLDAERVMIRALWGLIHPLRNPMGLHNLIISQEELVNLAMVSRQLQHGLGQNPAGGRDQPGVRRDHDSGPRGPGKEAGGHRLKAAILVAGIAPTPAPARSA